MRALLFLLVVGCSPAVVEPNDDGAAGAGGMGGHGGAVRPVAGASGVEIAAGVAGMLEQAGAGGEPAIGDAGAAGVGGSAGQGGDSTAAAGESGAPEAGAGGAGAAPGSLWGVCTNRPDGLPCNTADLTCGQYLEREGGQPGYVCTFLCWSMQGLKMAPDAALIAKCESLGGVCFAASSGYYPTCVPSLPQPAR